MYRRNAADSSKHVTYLGTKYRCFCCAKLQNQLHKEVAVKVGGEGPGN